MARIAVVSSHPPFSEGGHLVIARALVRALHEAGHEAELVYTPQNRYGRQGAAYLANWLTDVGESMGRRDRSSHLAPLSRVRRSATPGTCAG